MNRGRDAPALAPDDFIGPADPIEARARADNKLSDQIKAALGARRG